MPWWSLQGSLWTEVSIYPVHFDRKVIVMLVLLLIFSAPHLDCLNGDNPILICSCRVYLRPNTYFRPGGHLRKYVNQSLLAVVTCDLQLFRKLLKPFPTSTITVIALLPEINTEKKLNN